MTKGQEDSLEYLRVSSTASLMETAAGRDAYFISYVDRRRIARSTRDRRASVHPRRQAAISASSSAACSFTPATTISMYARSFSLGS